MTVRLYMDQHVPAAITAGLRRRNVDVLTAAEDGNAATQDEPLLERATFLQRTVRAARLAEARGSQWPC